MTKRSLTIIRLLAQKGKPTLKYLNRKKGKPHSHQIKFYSVFSKLNVLLFLGYYKTERALRGSE
jgi:hypothetical protein